jgi:hypothetical protein
MLNWNEIGIEPELAIREGYGMADLGDNPDTHRWRAWWATTCDGIVTGIELTAYPVTRLTPAGAWIDTIAGRQASKQPWEEGAPGYEWAYYGAGPQKDKWVANGSSSAWAKPTRDEAVRSLAARLARWTGHLAWDVKRARLCTEALAKLRPDLSRYADEARLNLRATGQGA